MGRKKVNLQYIADAASRRTTFMKRHRGIIKKVRELSILCDVRACAVIYGQDETNAVVWPNKDETKKILQFFKDMPRFEQGKRMLNQEGFINQCMLKRQDQVLRHRRENDDLMMTFLVTEELAGRNLHDLGVDETFILADFVQRKANEVHLHIEGMKPGMATVTPEGMRGKAAMDAVARENNWCMEMPKPNGPRKANGVHLHIEGMKSQKANVTAERVRGKAPMDAAMDVLAQQTNWCMEMQKANEVIEEMKSCMASVTAEGVRGNEPMDAAMNAMALQTNWCMEMPKPNGPMFFGSDGGSAVVGTVKMEHLTQPYSGGGRRLVGPFNPF